jgi:hypothetical protein
MPPMNDASERLFQDKVEHIAKMNGWLIFHASPKMVRPGVWRSDGKGFPDLCLAHRTRGCIFAELKSQHGRLSHDQIMWAEALIASGIEHYVWRPSQLDLIAERLGRSNV